MTELPELPPRPTRTRPLPPHGLEQALSAGRRRRTQFLGGTAAGGTLAVVMVAALLATPGGRSDSLQVASPPPQPAASDDPSPGPPAAPSPAPTGAGSPAAVADPAPDPAATPQARPQDAASPAPPGEQGGPAPDARPAYREATDEDAPGYEVCRPTKVAAGACAYSTDNGPVVRRGTAVTLASGQCNGPGDGATVYEFRGGQETELVVQRDGREVFRFSSTVRYAEGAHERHLRGGRCLEFRQAWRGVTTAGDPVPAGEYRLVLSVLPSGLRYDFGDGTSMRQQPFVNSSSATVQLVD